jgi:N-acetylglucosaminyldiphosphoundecaprenol N-acetyl-beta-D-mannosaminyltransferase
MARPVSNGADRVTILGCSIDRLDMDETVHRCQQIIESGGFGHHTAVNAAKLIAFRNDPRLREIIADSTLVNADGQSVVWASRLLGDPLSTRVTGIDLMMRLLDVAEQRRYCVFILGARKSVLEQAVSEIRRRYPRLPLAGYFHGHFDDEHYEAVARSSRRASPDILFVAMSSPRKEYFLGRFAQNLGVPFVMGVGGSIDVLAGVRKRAPVVWQRLGLEWLYRLIQEPRRLARRYLVTNTQFIALVSLELVRRRLLRRGPVQHRGDPISRDPAQ